MTPEGRLLAALSHLESAYQAAFKAAVLHPDPKRAEILCGLGNEIHNEYLDLENAALMPRKVKASIDELRDAFKAVKTASAP